MQSATIRAVDPAANPAEDYIGRVNDALKVVNAYGIEGEDATLGGVGVYPAGSDYQAGAGVTDATDINLGPAGAVGDLLEEVVIRNTDAQFVDVSVEDGGVTIDALTTRVAANSPGRIVVGLRSKVGGWRINLDINTGGTITNVKYLAIGVFS